jgi:hypothetical protein
MSLQVGEPVHAALAQAVVLRAGDAAEGAATVTLGTLWEEGPCALVFLRHFGCPACGENVAELLPRLAELRALGVRVALVGSGEPPHVAPFVALAGLEGRTVDVLTDPTLAAYRAADLARGTWATLNPVSLYRVARAMARGYPHGPALGDPLQQGGTLLVDHGGRLAFYHRNAGVGDHPPAVELVDAALALAARAAAARDGAMIL